ncbi:MAG: APC family permease [Saprospiraceae bacterium]|nr:APC family permease [Saprospiraceae bacterium]
MQDQEQLKREIGVQGLAAGVVNFIVGAGIFVLPALVATILGGSSILAYLVCGLLLLMIMLCFAEMGSQVVVSGGPYAYIEAAFGPFIGFLSNILFWFGYCVLADAAIANAMADMLALKIPLLLDPTYRGIFFFIVFALFAWINITGVKHGMRLVKTLTLIKLTPLVLLVIVGVFWIELENLEFGPWPSSLSLGEAAILLFFAFGGGEGALSTSGEIKRPQFTIPRGLLLGVGSVITLYICIQLVSQGVIGPDLINYKEAPLAEVASRIIGPGGLSILVLAAAISIFGTLSGSIMQYPRILYAGGRKGSAPKYLAAVHAKFSTPYLAIITYALFDFLFAISGGFQQLAVISSAALLLTYLGVVLATVKFRLKNKDKTSDAFRMPGGLLLPILSIVVILWFLSQLAVRELVGVLIFFVVLTVIYLAKEFFRK